MHTILEKIVAEKKKEVERLKKGQAPFPQLPDLPPRRNFLQAVSQPGRINLIAEIKFASPSAGAIREKADPAAIARIYERAGAAAISLLTDKKFFGGDLHFLPEVKKAVLLPILRKDFILDKIQVEQSLKAGADAILLIARLLPKKKLKALLRLARESGLDVLTEVHDREDLDKALDSEAEIIGINNRDLDTFTINLQTTHKLAAQIPPGHIIVGESGINSPKDIEALKGSKINAVLVGSSLMGSQDIESKTRELVEAGR